MNARTRADADRVVVAEVIVRICDRGPEPGWHTDRQLFGPWYRFEAEVVADGGPRAPGMSPWDALHRLVTNHRAQLGTCGVAS